MIDPEFIKQWLLTKLKSKDIVVWLLAINIVLYLLVFIVNIIGLPFGMQNLADLFIKNCLAIPPQFQHFIYKPYSILTYQFLHGSFFHLFSNIILLFYFGNIFISLTHKKKLLPLYIYGGFFGAFVFLLIYNLNPALSNTQNLALIGASGSVMAIVGAVCSLVPEKEIYLFARFKVKYKWIAAFFVLVNIIGLNGPKAAGNYVHLAGLLFGFLFIIMSKNGIDIVKPFNSVFDYLVSLFDFRAKPRVSYVNEKFKQKKVYKPTSNNSEKEKQAKIDAILDKISKSGYDKLNKAEKEFLFNNSKK